MTTRNGSPPLEGRPPGVSRRQVIGGMLAAALVPTAIEHAFAAGGRRRLASPAPGLLTRFDHTITPLPDGRILVAGGTYLAPLSSVQILDPASGAWLNAAPMLTPRYLHAAVAMGGGVLVAGGLYNGVLSAAEMYDPAADRWTAVASLNVPRYGHSAAAAGGGAIVMGGQYLQALAAPEMFDGNTWTLLEGPPVLL